MMKRLRPTLTAFASLILLALCSCSISDSDGYGSSALDGWSFDGDIDASVRAGADFYQYAVGSWLKSNPLKNSAEQNGTIADSEMKSQQFLESVMSGNSGDIMLSKIAAEIKSAESDWEKQVRVPAERMLARIGDASTKDDLVPVFAEMIQEGYNPVMSVTFTPVARETEILLQLGRVETTYQDGLPEDYYILAALDVNSGVNPALASQIAAANIVPKAKAFVTRLETGVDASSAASRQKISSRLSSANYAHKVLVAAGFSPSHISSMKYIGMLDAYFKNLDSADADELKAYLSLLVYDEMYRFSKNVSVDGMTVAYRNFEYAFKKRAFAKYNLLKCIAETNVTYEMKASVKAMLEEIRSTFLARLPSVEWMSDAAKARAREKAKSMKFFVGAPDSYNQDFILEDFEKTNCFDDVHLLEKKTFRAFIKNVQSASEGTMWALFPTIAETTEFNAYYHLPNNCVIINPLVSCKPVCDLSKGDAYAYGVLGFILGHEFTHGFDATGAKYGKNGEERHWWTADDERNFAKKEEQFIALFSSYDIYSGVIAQFGEMNDGKATLAENMADFGGLTLAHEAFMAKMRKELSDGEALLDAERKFFLAVAQCYKGNQSNFCKTHSKRCDIHSNFKIRVNGNVLNVPSWYAVFDVQEGDALYKAPSERIVLW